MSQLKWIWLSDRCGVGSTDVLTLISRLNNIDAIFEADFDTYISLGIGERTADRLSDKNLDGAYAIVNWCRKNRVGIVCFDDDNFPSSLRSLKNPPVVLYFIGTFPDFNNRLCISVVGTRKMSEYGMRSAYKIAYEIASAGAITISGMALGIDGVAACASIAAGGCTVAVLGCGIDRVYPSEHKKLKSIIATHGAVITEYPPSTSPAGFHFPVRNRIISGLGQGTLVVDSPESSGALITAKNAIIQGKDIYAVPGNIDGENTSGTNALIRDGATAVLCGRDVIKNYAFLYRHCIDMQKLTSAESRSDFDKSALLRMGVGTRANVPDKKPIQNEHLAPKKEEKFEGSEQYSSFEEFKKQLTGKTEKKKPTSKKASSKVQATEPTEKKVVGDNSEKILESLSDRQRAIFSEMPMDKPVTVDYFTKTGFSMGEVISALTVLEIKGLVSSLPGALYIRK